MSLEVAVYTHRSRFRAKNIAKSMFQGIGKVGDKPTLWYPEQYKAPVAPVAVFYGLSGYLPQIWNDYRANPELRAVYIDLGYWGRKAGGTFEGYHKVSVGNRHPTKYFQRVKHKSDRLRALKLEVEMKRRGECILIAGMGEKGANWEGFEHEEWERKAIAHLRKHTQRPIIYRPKPSCSKARPIDGTLYMPDPEWNVDQIMPQVWATVSHHSNVAGDGFVRGVPALVWDGVGTVLGSQKWDQVEKLKAPGKGEVEQWAADVAYCQWNLNEMRSGECWAYLKEEGLVG